MRQGMSSTRAVSRQQTPTVVPFARAPGLLDRLGYAPDEIHYGALLTDGRMSVPAVVGEEVGYFLVDTAQRDDDVMTLGRVPKCGLPYERTDERWGQSTLPSLFALGRSRSESSVRVFGTE